MAIVESQKPEVYIAGPPVLFLSNEGRAEREQTNKKVSTTWEKASLSWTKFTGKCAYAYSLIATGLSSAWNKIKAIFSKSVGQSSPSISTMEETLQKLESDLEKQSNQQPITPKSVKRVVQEERTTSPHIKGLEERLKKLETGLENQATKSEAEEAEGEIVADPVIAEENNITIIEIPVEEQDNNALNLQEIVAAAAEEIDTSVEQPEENGLDAILSQALKDYDSDAPAATLSSTGQSKSSEEIIKSALRRLNGTDSRLT